MNQRVKPIDNLKDIPVGLSDEDRRAFLEENGVSEHFLENVAEAPEEERPRPRTRPINIRFDDFTLGRLKNLAESRNVGYQTLLKEFVVERLYEEERRQGVLSASRVPEAGYDDKPTKAAKMQNTAKQHDWQSWVFEFVKENEKLLEDPEIDSITLSRLARNSSTPLLKLSREIKEASAKESYPAARLRRMLKGYERLKEFTEAALNFYAEKFGELEEKTGDGAYDATREAEKIIEQSR